MDIIVHGTKEGRKEFTKKNLSGLFDVSPDKEYANAIGQEAFGIRLIENSIIFSKYKIIRDVKGDKRTGWLAFSLFLYSKEKLSGINIISLLDKVSGEYCRTYMPENDNNLKDVREDWGFLDAISREYKSKLDTVASEDIENLLSGTKEDAFIYYKNKEELQKYFDAPYEEEYCPFRQVLFIDEKLQGDIKNPLNALRHSENDLTDRIDLLKSDYKLLDYKQKSNDGVGIEILVNGKPLKSNNKITNVDNISIRYFKKYFKDTNIPTGKLHDDHIKKYLTIREDKKINVNRNIVFEPVRKDISFQIKYRNGTTENYAKITCKRDNDEKKATNNQVTFKGEDIGQQWKVSAKKSENLYSDEITITPDEIKEVKLTLNEKKKVEFNVLDENSKPIKDFKINGKSDLSITFLNDDIRKDQKIILQSEGYKDCKFSIQPGKIEKPYNIFLEKEKVLTTESGDKNKINFFTQPEVIAAIVSAIIILAGVSYGAYNYFKPTNSQTTEQVITAYINGNEIFGDQLDSLNNLWGKQQPEMKLGKSLLSMFGVDNNKKYKQWEKISNDLNYTIAKRNDIDSLDFDSLKTLRYSHAQLNFKKSFFELDSSKYEVIRKGINNVSILNLDQIADSINVLLISTNIATEKPKITEVDKKDKEEETKNPSTNSKVETEVPKEKVNPKPQKEATKPAENNTKSANNNNKTNEIIEYLKGNELKEANLNQYLKEANLNKNLRNSIQLCLEFWKLDGSENNSYSSFQSKLNNDKTYSNSALKKFVDDRCKEKNPKYLNDITGYKLITTLQKLKERV